MSQIFAVTSGKGGVGKSTVSAGLAFAFAGLSKKTLLVDMDEGLRCLDIMLGVDKSAVFDLWVRIWLTRFITWAKAVIYF